MKNSKKVKIFKNLNKPILILTLVYAVMGAFLILDASSISSKLAFGVSYYYFKNQLTFIAAALVASFFIIKFPTKLYKKISGFLSMLFIGLILFIYAKNKLFSSGVNEVTIPLFGFVIQPAEFLKVFLVMYMSSYYDDWVNNPKHGTWTFMWPLILCGSGMMLILLGGDFGSAAVMTAIFALVFAVLPCKEKYVSIVKTIGIAGLLLCVFALKFLYIVVPEETLQSNYRLNRFIYKNPCDRYEENSGYQVCNGYIAIDNGGILGSGIGGSTQKYMYLPASHTDFIFPIVIEEFGVLSGIAIILGYMVILYFVFKEATSSYKLQNSMICYGIGIYFMLHIFVNLGGVLGIMPLTGVPLPFLSYGGSFCVTIICAFAVVQRISIENRIEKAKRLERREK